MDYQISIDFGNSFTKVGIRPCGVTGEEGRASSLSSLLQDEGLRMDENNFCIPTLAARAIENGREVWCYGNDVVEKATNREGYEVFRNWKPRFFSGQDDPEIQQIGRGFFGWLRQFVDAYGQAKDLPNTRDMPVRITLPAFGLQSAAAHSLVDILTDTGWNPTGLRPAVAEPVANSIGIFSEGKNAVWKPESRNRQAPEAFPFYPEMFGDSDFFLATKNYALYSDEFELDRTHWVFIADLGGYTADFAMLGFDLARPDKTFEAAATDAKEKYAYYSEPIGIADLDARVRAVLPAEQQEAFDDMLDEVDPRLETFHRMFYTDFRPFRSRGVRIGSGPELAPVKERVGVFAEEVATYAERFLDLHQFERVDQLLITGGGYNVPLIREALIRKLGNYQLRRVYRPVSRQDSDLPSRHSRLDPRFVRGSTALGGASVYFEGLAS